MKKWFSGLAIALAAAVSGCTVGDHSQNDINKFSQERLEKILSATTQPVSKPASRNRTLSHEEAVEISERYGNLPANDLSMYTPIEVVYPSAASQPTTRPAAKKVQMTEVRRLDTTGPINQYVDEIKDLRNSIPEYSERTRFVVGNPDESFIGSRSRENQTSNRDGLLAVDYFSNGKNRGIFVQIDQVTGINGKLKERAECDITVKLGQASTQSLKKKTDGVFVADTAVNAGFGYWLGGPYGAAGAAAETAIDGLWSWIEGTRVPRDALISDKRINVGNLTGKDADVYNVLETAEKLGADSIALVPYKEGMGILYLRNAKEVKYSEDGAIVRTERKGVNYLAKVFYKALIMGTRIGYDSEVVRHCHGDGDTKIIREPCPDDCGGGRTGGPGGNGSYGGRSTGGGAGR